MRAEVAVEIARSPEEVFAYLTDVANLSEWQSDVRGAELVGGGAPRAGARIAESRHLFGRELRLTLEIAAYAPPRLFVLRALDGPVPFSVHHELAAAGSGTQLTVVAEAAVGPPPGFASGLMARRAERQFRKNFERLKDILES